MLQLERAGLSSLKFDIGRAQTHSCSLGVRLMPPMDLISSGLSGYDSGEQGRKAGKLFRPVFARYSLQGLLLMLSQSTSARMSIRWGLNICLLTHLLLRTEVTVDADGDDDDDADDDDDDGHDDNDDNDGDNDSADDGDADTDTEDDHGGGGGDDDDGDSTATISIISPNKNTHDQLVISDFYPKP